MPQTPADEALTAAQIEAEQGWSRYTVSAYLARSRAHRDAGDPQRGDMPEPDEYDRGRPMWRRSTLETWMRNRPYATRKRKGA